MQGRRAGGAGSLTPARLLERLAAVVAAVEREASSGSGGNAADAREARALAAKAVESLELACQTGYGSAAAGAGAGRVQLPSPSAEVDAALDSLAQIITAAAAATSGVGGARARADPALRSVHALAYCSPGRVARLARHGGLMKAVCAAMDVRGDVPFLAGAMNAGVSVLTHASMAPAARAAWRATESGANLRALAAACAGAAGAMPVRGGAEVEVLFDRVVCTTLAVAIDACPDAQRPELCAAMLSKRGFGDALSACVARCARAIPAPGAPGAAEECAGGALTLAAALCSPDALGFQFREETAFLAVLPRLETTGPASPARLAAANRLLAAAPALLERVVDVVAAGAPWYKAAAAALAPGGASGGGPDGTMLVFCYGRMQMHLWSWAVEVLRLMPEGALAAAGGADRALIKRLGPPLLGLAEAALAVAGALPGGPNLGFVTPEVREMSAVLASAAIWVFGGVAEDLGDAAPALVEGAPGALAALVRLSASDLPLLAVSDQQASATAERVCHGHAGTRFGATMALDSVLGSEPRLVRQVAALLAASPALAAAVGAAVGPSPGERRFLEGSSEFAVPFLVQRRARIAGVLARVAACAAAADAGGDASWLRRLTA